VVGPLSVPVSACGLGICVAFGSIWLLVFGFGCLPLLRGGRKIVPRWLYVCAVLSPVSYSLPVSVLVR